MRFLSRRWKLFIVLSLVAGSPLRMTYVSDMEYKEDEEINFNQSQVIQSTGHLPWVGMPSGVYVPNPGMSFWIFAGVAKVTGAKSPTELAHGVQLVALLGILLLIPFALRFVDAEEREPWLWAYALAMVNPFLIVYQRKLWPEPFMPIFIVPLLMGWWRKDRPWGAFFFGLLGACLGQVHMSGFFMAGALTLWTVLSVERRAVTKWRFWFLGSVLGTLPLIPWMFAAIQAPRGGPISGGIGEMLQFKYWVFWITDPLGLHLGNPLGLLIGSSLYQQISDFVRYPFIGGKPTYLVGLAHLLVVAWAIFVFTYGLRTFFRIRSRKLPLVFGSETKTNAVQGAVLWGCGLLMSMTGINIRRYYMATTFPFEGVWLARTALLHEKWGRKLLLGLWILQLFISANFVGYIHVNEGSTQGDYGDAYHVIMKRRLIAPPHP